jgi:hypothetical protein
MHGISSGQFYTWRKQFRSGALTGFIPVSMATEVAALPAPVASQPATLVAGHVKSICRMASSCGSEATLTQRPYDKFFWRCDDPRIKSGDPGWKRLRLFGLRRY